MKKFIFSRYRRSLFIIIFYSSILVSIGTSSEIDLYQIGLRGITHYQEENYKKASKLIKEALDGGDYTFASTYADICLRDLDEVGHEVGEAATWYVRAAEVGDGDAISYLRSLSITDGTQDFKIRRLTKLLQDPEILENANQGFLLYTQEKYPEAVGFIKNSAASDRVFRIALTACILFLPYPFL